MISRADFTAAFAQRVRFMLQKHERETQARAAGGGPLRTAEVNLDAAISELADYVYDALEEKAPLEPCA